MTVAYVRMTEVYNQLAKEKFPQRVKAKMTLKKACSHSADGTGKWPPCRVLDSAHPNVSLVPVPGTVATNWENFPETPDCKLACYADGYSDFGVTVCYKSCLETVDMIKDSLGGGAPSNESETEFASLLQALGKDSQGALHWARTGAGCWPDGRKGSDGQCLKGQEYRVLVSVTNLVAKEVRCLSASRPQQRKLEAFKGQRMKCWVRRTCSPYDAKVTHYLGDATLDWKWTRFPKEGTTHKFSITRTAEQDAVRYGCLN